MTSRRVLIPERPGSVHYHSRHCGTINADRAAILDEQDARDLGYRPHNCVTKEWNGPDPSDGRPGVPA